MSAGIPGFGLSGLFFIACALLGLPLEGWRILRGRSTRESRRAAARHFVLAVVIIAAADLTFRFLVLMIAADPGAADAETGRGGAGVDLFALPVEPLAITAALLTGLLLVGKGLQVVLAVSARATARRRARRLARASV